MHRRDFLFATAAITAASAAAPLLAHVGAAPRTGHRLLRLDTQRALFLSDAVAAPVGDAPVRVHFDRLIPARRGGLDTLDIVALFDSGGGEPWRHIAWRYRRGDRFGSSRASSFVATPGVLRALEFGYGDSECGTQPDCCACGAGGGLPLTPGRYLLVFDGGELPRRRPLRFSGDWNAPLAETRFDCLSVRVETEAPGPDLSLRADLACLAAMACAPA